MRAGYVAVGLLVLGVRAATAQQATVTTPFHAVGDGFFERTGVHWGLSGKNWNFTFGAPGMAPAPFGGFDPTAGANLGVARVGKDMNGFFHFSAAQGSRRSYTSQAPSVTNMNGVPGFFHDTSQSPFVISYIPVVGGFPVVGYVNPLRPPMLRANPAYASPVARAMANYRAGRPLAGPRQTEPPEPGFRARNVPDVPKADDPKLHEDLILIGPGASKRSNSGKKRLAVARADQNQDAEDWFQRGCDAEEAGKRNVAKLYYQMASRRASGKLKKQILTRLDALKPAQ